MLVFIKGYYTDYGYVAIYKKDGKTKRIEFATKEESDDYFSMH